MAANHEKLRAEFTDGAKYDFDGPAVVLSRGAYGYASPLSEREQAIYAAAVAHGQAQAQQQAADLTELRELRDDLSRWKLCPEHQPNVWESDGTCPICEGHTLSASLSEQAKEIEGLEQEFNAGVKSYQEKYGGT